MFKNPYLGLLFLGLITTGCSSEDDPTDTSEDTDTDSEESGFAISGVGIDLATQTPVGEGLCVSVQDPTPAITGGDPLILSETTTGADGSYTLENVTTSSSLGLLVVISDCPDAAEATVMPTATGIGADSYSDLGDGDLLDGQTSYSIDSATQEGVDASLTAAGYTGASILEAGSFVGFVFDAAGVPLAGATVECAGTGCDGINTYYQDADAADGLFTTAGAVNETTDASSLFWIPGAPISNYEASHPDYSFASQLAGSSPGTAVLIGFDAE